MHKLKKAFTLIELLVVIAIIAILAAILFPVFAQAKQAAKKTQSLSNVKQQALGIQMYAGDSDDVLPFSEYGGNGFGDQVQWYATVYPYIKSGKTETSASGTTQAWGNDGLWKDPAFPDQVQGQQYGVNYDLCPSNYGGGTLPSVGATAVDAPADKVLIMNKNRNGAYWGYPFFSTYQWFWTLGLGGSGGASDNNPGGSEIASGQLPRDGGWYLNKDGSGNGGSCPTTADCERGQMPAYRYNGIALAAYLDGHAAGARRNQLKWFKNIAFKGAGQAYPWNNSWYPY
jgi:prepilin-type N-terminal cleavage/methylation domain-containing protein